MPISIKRFTSKRFIYKLVILAIILLGLSAWLWWHFIFTSPKRVFDDMLRANLRTVSYAKRISQAGDSQSLDQATQLWAGKTNMAHSVTYLSQTGTSAATVATESIGTPKEDFVRYTQISTKQKDAKGKDLDFFKVLNVWGKTGSQQAQLSGGQLFSQSVFGILPIADLKPADSDKLYKLIKEANVYQPDYNSVQRISQNGRPALVYHIQADTEGYIKMLKAFSQIIGLHQFDSLDPSIYKDHGAIKFDATVDVLSRQLVKVKYDSADREETYGAYGIVNSIKIPNSSVPIEELQQRLESLQ
ncbi:MAG TPA: hypothetical protein VLG25_00085 [Patescibacteria group bacterium]|nr:hypothetical protein [Patescibacteria group bacterium]